MTSMLSMIPPRNDVIKSGKALCKIGLGLQHPITLVLRGYNVPFRLEIYESSNFGKVISLKRVKHFRCFGPFARPTGFKIKFHKSPSLALFFSRDDEATEWMAAIQMHSLMDLQPGSMSDHQFRVILLPNHCCHLHGSFLLHILRDSLRVCNPDGDNAVRITWPVHTIRFYCDDGKFFRLATGSSSETGEGIFHFEVQNSAEAKLIYKRVAASVSHNLQNTAANCVPVSPSIPPSFPPATVEEGREVPSSSSLPLPGPLASQEADLGLRNDNSGGGSRHLVFRTPGNSSDSNENFCLNRFYLLRIGCSIEKPAKSPNILGLSQPKREFLETFASTTNHDHWSVFGVILYGPSNCGKRLLVEAASCSLGATIIRIPPKSLLQLHEELGTGLQLLFDVAVKMEPCIIHFKNLEQILVPKHDSDDVYNIFSLIDNAYRKLRTKRIGFVTTVSDLDIDLRFLSFCCMEHKIYVPPPCFETRLEIFQKELRTIFQWKESEQHLQTMAKRTVEFNFAELTDLYQDIRKIAISNAMDNENIYGNCVIELNDQTAVMQVITSSISEHQTPDSTISLARFYAEQLDSDMFAVKMLRNETLSDVNLCFLQISQSSVEVRDLDPNYLIISWQFEMIRQYSWEPLKFELQVGRSSPTNEGTFHFQTVSAKEIFDILETRLKDRQSNNSTISGEHSAISDEVPG